MTPTRRAHRAGRGERGQALVEFAVVIPVFLLLLCGMLELGFAFSDRLTLGNATREGARIGAALATGMSTSCSGDPAGVDTTVVASVQNILRSGGSDVDLSDIGEVRIYRASTSGSQVGGSANVWHYTPGSGPDADSGTGVEIIDFSPSSVSWPACARDNGSAPDSIAVQINYTYRLRTPLAAVMAIFGGDQGASIALLDRTVMALNPTD